MTCAFLKKNIISLIWALNHINNNGIIFLNIRETITPNNKDFILLLSQYGDIKLVFFNTSNEPTAVPNYILLYNIKNKINLIKILKEILDLGCKDDLSFLKINKVSNSDLEIFYKDVEKPTEFVFNKMFEYMDCFNSSNSESTYPYLSEENKNLFLVKNIILFLYYYMSIEDRYVNDKYMLYEIIEIKKASKILQFGMGNGSWSVFLLTFLKFFNIKTNKYKLTSIDEYQLDKYMKIGIDNITKLNLFENHKLIIDHTYIKKMIENKKQYDIIFINEECIISGLTDISNAISLLSTNGYIVIEGILNENIKKILKNIEKKYNGILDKLNNYELTKHIKNLSIYIKIV